MSLDKMIIGLEKKISDAVWSKDEMPGVSQSVINQHNAELRAFLKIINHEAVPMQRGKHICCTCGVPLIDEEEVVP